MAESKAAVLRERFRILWSWREKAAQCAVGEGSRPRLPKTCNDNQEYTYDLLDGSRGRLPSPTPLLSQASAQPCESEFQRARNEGQAIANAFAASLRAALARQNAIITAVGDGRLPAKKANRRNRELEPQIAAWRAAIRICNETLSASSAEAVGGYIDAKLEAYPGLLLALEHLPAQGVRRWFTPFRFWDALAIVGAILALFLLWHLRTIYAPKPEATWNFSSRPGVISVQCTNRSPQEIRFYVPWPGKGRALEGPAFGAALEVDEGRGFHIFTGGPELWANGNTPVRSAEAFRIPPTLSAQASVNLTQLRTAVPGVRQVRAVGVDGSGWWTTYVKGPTQGIASAP